MMPSSCPGGRGRGGIMNLKVQVLEARGLPSRASEVHVKVKVGSSKARTALISSTPSPSRYEDFFFKVDDLNSHVVVTVHGHRGFFGQVKIPITLVINADKQILPPLWYRLQKRTQKSKRPVSGEIQLALSLYGRSYSNNSQHGSTTTSAANDREEPLFVSSTPDSELVASTTDLPQLSRISSSESLLSLDNDAISGKKNSSCEKKKSNWRSFVDHLSSLLFKRSRNAARSSKSSPARSVLDSRSSEISHNPENNEDLVSSSFFEDDPKVDPGEEELVAPLTGGILIDQSYAVSMGRLNGILFKPGSLFVQDLAIAQNTKELSEGPWMKLDDGLPYRIVTYSNAPTKLVGHVKATEEQRYLRADKGGFVVTLAVSTPDVPFGTYFQTELQFCITPGPNLSPGEKTSHLRVSWRMNFLRSTLIKSLIEHGAQEGLKDNFKLYQGVLTKYARCIDDPMMNHAEGKELQSEWQLAKEYFFNLPVLASILLLGVLLLHIYFPWPKNGNVLEFCYLDLPDSLGEFITSAIVAMYLENVAKKIWTFLRARVCRGSDHGVKAHGEGWLLAVTLVGGEKLSPSVETVTCDPYVVFTCNGKTRSSSVKLNTLNPEWNEVFEFDATEDAPSTMYIEVFDFEGPFSEAESLGYAEINFLKQSSEELADLWVQLEGKHAWSLESKLHLRICLTNTQESDSVTKYIQKVEKKVGKKIMQCSPQKNSSFQRLFSLPSEEFLVNDFACAVKHILLLQGRLFLSPRMMGFYSNIFGHKTKFSILWDDIDEIRETSQHIGSAGLVLNPSILVFTKKGRGKDAYPYSKSLDAKGRFKFQFQSFVHFGLAYRTVVTLWRNRVLSLEQRMEIVANVEAGDTDYVAGKEQADNTESFLRFKEATMFEVYSTNLPFSVRIHAESLVFLHDKENLEEKIMDKLGCMNYTATPWEKVNDSPRLEQRQQFYKLNHCLCQFGSRVMCIQQRNFSGDAQECVLSENFTLQDVPFGDHFQVHVRREVQNISIDPPISSCKVFLGVSWQKSTLFQERITKKCIQNFTKLLKENIELTVRELLAYKNDSVF